MKTSLIYMNPNKEVKTTYTYNQSIQDYLIQEHGAVYKREGYVEPYINADEERIQRYLGTYFPRSYCIGMFTADVLKALGVTNTMLNNEPLNILDIGTGAGPQLISIMGIFNRFGFTGQHYLTGIEGNPIMSDKFEQILTWYNKNNNNVLNYLGHLHRLNMLENNNLQPLANRLEGIDRQYDMILCFSSINELYRTNSNGEYYYELFRIAEDYLSENGVLILVDVCDKTDNKDHFPVVMNREFGQFIRNDGKLAPIYPMSCMYYYDRCSGAENDCYMNHVMNIKNYHKDNFKFTIKILAKSEFAQGIKRNFVRADNYVVARKRDGSYNICRQGRIERASSCKDATCAYSNKIN